MMGVVLWVISCVVCGVVLMISARLIADANQARDNLEEIVEQYEQVIRQLEDVLETMMGVDK